MTNAHYTPDWTDCPIATALFDKAIAHINAHDELPLDIEAQLEALRAGTLTDLWIEYDRENDQDGFEAWHGQPSVEDALVAYEAKLDVRVEA
jgi:hypothetical protein